MLSIYKGSIEEVKAEMKASKAEARTDLKDLRKEEKKRSPFSLKPSVKAKIAELEFTLSFCEVTKFVPVFVAMGNGVELLLNQLMLKEFARRLKGHRIFARVDYDEHGRLLVLEYSKGRSKGRLELYELPNVFNINSDKIPHARFEEHVTVLLQTMKEVM